MHTTYGHPVVNFINVLCASTSYKILAPKTTKLAFGFEILAPKILYKKRARKRLMKLTPDQASMTGFEWSLKHDEEEN
jgi:hypothetical protein